MPFFLICQTGAVEQSPFKNKWETVFIRITSRQTDITHISYLLGNE